MNNHQKSVEILQKAAAAMEKLPDNFTIIGICMTEENDEKRIGLHVYAIGSNGMPDDNALHDYAIRAGMKLWLEKATRSFSYDYIHALDENGTELYQGIERSDK